MRHLICIILLGFTISCQPTTSDITGEWHLYSINDGRGTLTLNASPRFIFEQHDSGIVILPDSTRYTFTYHIDGNLLVIVNNAAIPHNKPILNDSIYSFTLESKNNYLELALTDRKTGYTYSLRK